MKKLFTFLLTAILFCSGCTTAVITTPPASTPTSEPTAEPTATPAPQRVNLALDRPTAVSGTLGPAWGGRCAVDGNLDTFWASPDATGQWLTVDLGEPTYVGAISVSARRDGDQPNERYCMCVLGSDDEEFTTYEVLAELGCELYPAYGEWQTDITPSRPYRYYRLLRTYNGRHYTVSEFALYNIGFGTEEENRDADNPDARVLMDSTGKVLLLTDNRVTVGTYSLQNECRWLQEYVSDTEFYLINLATGRVLTQAQDGLALQEKTPSPDRLWHTVAADTWFRLVDGNGRMLEGKWDLFHAPADVYVAGKTDWLKGAYGIMMHVLPSAGDRFTLKRQFDVEALTDQLVEAGVTYYVISLGQFSGVYISPNERFSDIVTTRRNARDVGRDLIEELYASLSKHGIRLGVYIPYCPPFAEQSDKDAFGLGESNIPDMDTALLWSTVIREWSNRYGEKIALWWIDGGPSAQSDNGIFPVIADAARAGNPDAAVAFNSPCPVAGVCNYLGSENIYPLGTDPDGVEDEANWVLPSTNPVWTGKVPWGMSSFVGKGWQNQDMGRAEYTSELWARYAAKVQEEGGFLLLDTPITSDWLIQPSYMNIFTAIRDARK